MKTQAQRVATKYLSSRFKKTQEALQDECVQLLQQYKALEDELQAKDQIVRDTNLKLLESEKRLVEMTTYVRSLKNSIFDQERDLSGVTESKKKTKTADEETGENERAVGDQSKWKFLRLNLQDRLGQAQSNNQKFFARHRLPKPGTEAVKYFNAGKINSFLSKQKFGFYGS